jgi:hypothetical protein
LAASIAGAGGPRNCEKPTFYWLFRDGTALADLWGANVVAAFSRGICWSFVMLPAIGAVSTALDALQSLIASKSSSPQTTGFGQGSANPFELSGSSAASGTSTAPASGGSGLSQLSPTTLSALLAAQSQSSSGATTTSAPTDPSSALQDLFSQIDTNGNGQISKAEFENALGAGGTNLAQADKVFNKLDTNGDGSVSLSELKSALQGAGGKGGHHGHHVASSDGSSDASGSTGASGSSSATSADGSNTDPLLQALAGASSNSVTNSDGSTTTSVTYADGSKVTMVSPAASTSSSGATSSSSATSSYNIIEQMIQRAAQAISSGATASLSVSV